MDNLFFEPQNFIDNLGYMGKGMLAIIVVIGAIIISVYAVRAFSKLFEKKDK